MGHLEAESSAVLQGFKENISDEFANLDEALHETAMDIEEGADIVMVKPGTAYPMWFMQLNLSFKFLFCLSSKESIQCVV